MTLLAPDTVYLDWAHACVHTCPLDGALESAFFSDWALFLTTMAFNGNHTDVFTWLDLWRPFIVFAVTQSLHPEDPLSAALVIQRSSNHTQGLSTKEPCLAVLSIFLLIMNEQHKMDFSIHDIQSFFQFFGNITLLLLWPDDQPPSLTFQVKLRLIKARCTKI